MNSSIEAEIFIRKKVSFIYYLITIVTILLIGLVLFILNMRYQSIIKTNVIIKEDNNQYFIMLNIHEDELKYVINNNYIKLNDVSFYYKVHHIDEELYVSKNLENYKVVYLKAKLNKEYKINNLTLTAKINKSNKKIIYYIIDYLTER